MLCFISIILKLLMIPRDFFQAGMTPVTIHFIDCGYNHLSIGQL